MRKKLTITLIKLMFVFLASLAIVVSIIVYNFAHFFIFQNHIILKIIGYIGIVLMVKVIEREGKYFNLMLGDG